MFNYPSACVVRQLAAAAANTSTLTGAAVDIRDLTGQCVAIMSSGVGTGTAPTLNAKIQDSPDGSGSWADLAGATFAEVTDVGGTAGSQKIIFNKKATRGHVRLVGTIAGDTPSFPFSAVLIGQRKSS